MPELDIYEDGPTFDLIGTLDRLRAAHVQGHPDAVPAIGRLLACEELIKDGADKDAAAVRWLELVDAGTDPAEAVIMITAEF